MFLPISAENQPGLIDDLEGDHFVGHALSSATCELYHRYGIFLAPLTAALTTIKQCHFGHQCPAVINDGNQADGGTPAGEARTDSVNAGFSAVPAQSSVEKLTESEGSQKADGRAGRRCRPANKKTARTASGSQGIITSRQRHVCSSKADQEAQTNGQNITATGSNRS